MYVLIGGDIWLFLMMHLRILLPSRSHAFKFFSHVMVMVDNYIDV